jgi:hypothetical protein
LERGAPTRDSDRLRNRLAEYFLGLSYEHGNDTRFQLAQLMARELGIKVPSDYNGPLPEDVFRKGQLRDVLDSVTLLHGILVERDQRFGAKKAAHWRQLVARAMAEENIGYRVDDQGGVHYHVDQEFEYNRAGAVAALQHSDLANALGAHDDAYCHLDGSPPDTKAAVRSIFETVEIVARLICPESQNLNRWLAEKGLKEKCLAVMPSDPTEQRVAATTGFDGLADWVDGLHNYRHGQAVSEPVAPPMATSNSSTCGHPKFLQAGRSNYRCFEGLSLIMRSRVFGLRFGFRHEWLFGKRSASGRRHRPGSGGQATNPAGAVHRLVLWAGGLSTAGAHAQAAGGPAWPGAGWLQRHCGCA